MSDARLSLHVVAPDGHEYQYVLHGEYLEIGRGRTSHVVLPYPSVSRRHASLRCAGQEAELEDLGSTNGTFVNGERVTRAVLRHGDHLQIGHIELIFLAPVESPQAEAEGDADIVTHLVDGTFHTLVGRGAGPFSEAVGASMLQIVASPRGAKLVVKDRSGIREHALAGGDVVLGRSPACNIKIDDPRASQRHACVRCPPGAQPVLEDLGSRNGSYVNGVQVQTHRLEEGDTIRIGETAIIYCADPSASEPVRGRRRPVVVLPGFAGSELWLGGEKLWPDPARVLKTPEDQLLRDWGEALTVGRAVREITVVPGLARMDSFGRLVDFLVDELGYVEGDDLLEFPYDWREDNAVSAAALAKRIDAWRAARARPTERLVLLAHSMGGLVVRRYLAACGDDGIERCIYLGTPHLGTPSSLAGLLAGRGLLPFGLALKKVRRLMMEFGSLFQLLPAYECAWHEDDTPFLPLSGEPDWIAPPHRDRVRRAARFHHDIANGRSVNAPATCVFGYGQRTLIGMRLVFSNDLLCINEHVYGQDGDGTVAEVSATNGSMEIHPVNQQHGALFSDPDVLRRIRYELVERSP